MMHRYLGSRQLQSLGVAMAIVLFHVSVGQAWVQPPAYAEVFVSKIGYSVEYYPTNWTPTGEVASDDSGSFVTFSTSDGDQVVTIAVRPNPDHASVTEWIRGRLTKTNPNLALVRNATIRLAGKDGLLLAQPGTCGRAAMLAVVFPYEDLVFQMTYGASSGSERLPDFQRILESFRPSATLKANNVIPVLSLLPASEGACLQQSPATLAAYRCPGAPFYIPTEGAIMSSWGCWGGDPLPCGSYQDPQDPHKGIDLGPVGPDWWGNADPGVVDVYAPVGGYVVATTNQSIRLRSYDYDVDMYFAHMANNSTGESYVYVAPGTWVVAGQLLGKMGNWGVYETHLHFNIMIVGGSDLVWAHSKNPTPYLLASGLVFYPGWERQYWECPSCCGCGKLGSGKTNTQAEAARTAPSLVPAFVSPPTPPLTPAPPISSSPPDMLMEPGTFSATTSSGPPTGLDGPAMLPAGPASVLAREPMDPLRVPPGSANYLIPKAVFGSGGGPKASTNFRMNGTQGQTTALNRRQSANYVLMPGYWGLYTSITFDYGAYLPLVLRNY